MEHKTTTEYSRGGHVVRYWTAHGTRYEAYNDVRRWLGTCERERTAWELIENDARRPNARR